MFFDLNLERNKKVYFLFEFFNEFKSYNFNVIIIIVCVYEMMVVLL